MTLKFRRNLPLVLTLLGVLAFLVLTMGSQPIVPYTVDINALQTVQRSVIADNLIQLAGFSSAQSLNTGLPSNAIQP